MRVVIAPDSYKGSLSAIEVTDIMARAVKDEIPTAQIIKIPMADGGEGTVNALTSALDCELKTIHVHGPLEEKVEAYFGCNRDIAILEAANIFGLSMVPNASRNPLNTSSRGLGEAIKNALDLGYRKFIVGIGGSSTNDGGMGMLSSLGVKFLNSQGKQLDGFGRDLLQVSQADVKGIDQRIFESKFTVACDVSNPLLGDQGASYVYGPQKGASPQLCNTLDAAMAKYAQLIETELGEHKNRAGAGAAGGLGFAFLALGAELISGAKIVEEQTGLREYIRSSDWVFTGEGRSDGQTLFGKLPLHVARIAQDEGAKAVLISGSLGEGSEQLEDEFVACFSIVDRPALLEECIERAETLLYQCTANVIRLIKASASINHNHS